MAAANMLDLDVKSNLYYSYLSRIILILYTALDILYSIYYIILKLMCLGTNI